MLYIMSWMSQTNIFYILFLFYERVRKVINT